MRRTIIGLIEADRPEELTSEYTEDPPFSFQVEEAQQDLSGTTVYQGTAAKEVTEEETVWAIEEDGTIDSKEEDVTRVVRTSWFGVVDIGTPFVCVDSGAGRFVFEEFGMTNGRYDVDSFAARIEEEDEAEFWAVNWEEVSGAGAFFPASDDSPELLSRGLGGHKKLLGFTYSRNGVLYKGTIAGSGYLELYEPKFDTEEMAHYLQKHVLPDVHPEEDDD